MTKKEIGVYAKMSPERLALHLHMRKRTYIAKNGKAYKRHPKHKGGAE